MTEQGDLVRLVADPYPPYQYAVGGRVRGSDHAFVSAVFAAAGVRAETALMTWSECIEAVRSGAGDAVFQITPTTERRAWMCFSRPFRQARTVFLRRAGEGPERVRAADLPNLAASHSFGALRGFRYGHPVDEIPELRRFDGDEELLDALRAGVVDVAVVDDGVASHLLGGDDAITRARGFALERPLHLASAQHRVWVIRAFDLGLSRVPGPPG